jgi:hypothetical protein
VRTNDLIQVLAADNNTRPMPPGRALVLALIPGVAIALGLHLMILGLRPHLMSALSDPRVPFKIGLTILLAVLSGPLVLRLVKPGASARNPALMLAVVPVLLAAATVMELLVVPPAAWGQRLVGSNAVFCLVSIPFLAAIPLAGAFFALRRGAPEHPGLAGAAAGLFAGAIGAAFYATHCPDDSPLFVATWYSLAIGFVAMIGTAAGRRLLRW